MSGDGDSKRPSVPPRGPSAQPRAPSTGVPPASHAPSGPLRIPSTRPPPRISTSAALRLSSVDSDVANAARRVIESALGVGRGECVARVVDRARRDVGVALLDVCRTLGAEPIVHELESLGDRPIRQLPDVLRASLARAQASVLVIGFDDAEVGMRLEMLDEVGARGLRHGHMVGITRRSIIAGFSVDHTRILDATRAVRTRIRSDSTLRLRTSAGSDLEVT